MTTSEMSKPKIALTMGDVAGIGPEVIVRACADPRLTECCQPIVVGHPEVLRQAVDLAKAELRIEAIEHLDDTQRPPGLIACWNPTDDEAADVALGSLDARAGRAAYEYLIAAAQAALDTKVDAIATAPLNKRALSLAGLNYPGHTEILAELCGSPPFAMMLHLPTGNIVRGPHGLSVVHVTLHTSIQSVPKLLSTSTVLEKITLVDRFLRDIGSPKPRIGVCALNPHAGECGLFGDEEERVIAPAVSSAVEKGMNATGPFPADTLLRRAVSGEFDAVVAMYHDQGHIALKLIGFDQAVNITLGLPLIRTSPSHGTAFDIAGTGKASADGMLEAVRIAALLSRQSRRQKVTL